MALNDLVDSFETISNANADVNHFHYGSLSDVNVLSKFPFPLVILTTINGFDNEQTKRAHHEVRLFVVDTYNKDKQDLKSKQLHHAELKEIARTIWNDSVTTPTYIYDKSNRPFNFYEKAFNGLYNIAEYRADVQIHLPC